MGPTFRWLALTAALLAGPMAIAAEPTLPVRMAVTSVAARSRSQAPQLLEVSLESRLGHLLEGDLHLEIFAGRRRVQQHRIGPLVLDANVQRFRLTIPPVVVHNDTTPVTILGHFQGARERYDFPERDLVVPSYWKRWFVIAIARPEERAGGRDRFSFELALALERFNPLPAERLELVTYPTPLPPAAFPSQSAAYASFDMVALEGDGFALLREPQLAALAEWIEAGGSAIIRPAELLKAAHGEFLNRLLARNGEGPIWLPDAQGRLVDTRQSPPARHERIYCGLGRVVLLHQPLDPEEDFTAPDWTTTAAFLWKMRADQTAQVLDKMRWNLPAPGLTPDLRRPRPYGPQQDSTETALRRLLIPKNVQGVPFSVVVGILVVFLVLIAPVDFYLLGLLKARRFTWFSISALSLVFTFGTVKIAERIMGRVDHRTSLTFVDLAEDGRPAATSRFELHLTAAQRALANEYRNCLAVPVDSRTRRFSKELSVDGYYVEPVAAPVEQAVPSGPEPDLPLFFGRVPAQFAIERQMRQWSPALLRQTTFGRENDAPSIDWEAYNPALWTETQYRERFVEDVWKQEPEAIVTLFHGQVAYAFAPNEPQIELRPDGTGDPFLQLKGSPVVELVRFATVGPDRGLSAVLSQRAPTGDDTFEDLTLLDPSNPQEWVATMIVRRDDSWIVYRRFCRGARP